MQSERALTLVIWLIRFFPNKSNNRSGMTITAGWMYGAIKYLPAIFAESFSQDPDIPERESVPSSFMYREVLDNSDGSSTQLTASLEEARKFLALLTFLLRSHCQVRKQQQQQQQQRQQQQRQQQQRQRQQQGAEGTEAGHLELHAQYLRRHMRKITTDEVFSHLTVQLAVIEALLTQCCWSWERGGLCVCIAWVQRMCVCVKVLCGRFLCAIL